MKKTFQSAEFNRVGRVRGNKYFLILALCISALTRFANTISNLVNRIKCNPLFHLTKIGVCKERNSSCLLDGVTGVFVIRFAKG